MKLRSFHIYHYKSIQDSLTCSLDENLTILIGKNESGKTAVLEALADFDRTIKTFSSDSYPFASNEEPILKMVFDVHPDELNKISSHATSSLSDHARNSILSNGLIVKKKASGKYLLPQLPETNSENKKPSSLIDEMALATLNFNRERLTEIIRGISLPDLPLDNTFSSLEHVIKETRGLIKSRLNFIAEDDKKAEAIDLLREMTKIVETSAATSVDSTKAPSSDLKNAFIVHLPRFILFSDLSEGFPFEISIQDIKSNQSVMDFLGVTGLNADSLITTQDRQRRINLLNRATSIINADLARDWKQNRIELMAYPEGDKIIFGIKEEHGTDLYKVQQRSKGFQWFLAFYLRLNRYQNDNVVILIDEPGINLHHIAQQDIINVWNKKRGAHVQLIFSTHSPALIDPDKPNRIRVLLKNDRTKGSQIKTIENDDIDNESLFPLRISQAAQKILSEPKNPLNPNEHIDHSNKTMNKIFTPKDEQPLSAEHSNVKNISPYEDHSINSDLEINEQIFTDNNEMSQNDETTHRESGYLHQQYFSEKPKIKKDSIIDLEDDIEPEPTKKSSIFSIFNRK